MKKNILFAILVFCLCAAGCSKFYYEQEDGRKIIDETPYPLSVIAPDGQFYSFSNVSVSEKCDLENCSWLTAKTSGQSASDYLTLNIYFPSIRIWRQYNSIMTVKTAFEKPLASSSLSKIKSGAIYYKGRSNGMVQLVFSKVVFNLPEGDYILDGVLNCDYIGN